jgi:hypothetical protein
MPMPVVDIREMAMAVAQDAMDVAVHVGTVALPFKVVCVLVVRIVGMRVRML